MTKAVAVKGLAAAGLQPANGAAVPKAVVAKALSGPPPRAAPKRTGRPKAAAAPPRDVQPAPPPGDVLPPSPPDDARPAPGDDQPVARRYHADPKPKQSPGDLCVVLAESTGLGTKDIKAVLKALSAAAAKGLRDHDVFRLPNIVLLRRKKIAARAEKTKKMFGKEVYVAAKPAGHKITAFVVKQLKDAAAAE